jgi:cytochrome c oxidase subunit 1/cytochrome c oxidase subunit I+III
MARHTQVTETPAIVTANPQLAERLHKLWETEPGIKGFLGSVDHKEIGTRYIITAFLFLLLGGVEALVLRVQLAQPDMHVLSPEQYNQLFTMHGVSMIFSTPCRC